MDICIQLASDNLTECQGSVNGEVIRFAVDSVFGLWSQKWRCKTVVQVYLS